MKTKTMTSVREAAGNLLDRVVEGKNIRLDVSFKACAAGALDQLMLAIHEEAWRRGAGTVIESKEERGLCLSLLRH